MARGKWIRGKLGKRFRWAYENIRLKAYGTRLVWNSFKSTLRLPSKRREAVTLETTWAIRRLRLVKDGAPMFKFFLQMS